LSPANAALRPKLHAVLVLSLAVVILVGCASVEMSQATKPLSPAPTATLRPTWTVTPSTTATATPTPTSTATPTLDPLRLAVNLHPPAVLQGHALWIEVVSNRPVTVTGALQERPLTFTGTAHGPSWSVGAIPATAEPGSAMVRLSICDGRGADVSVEVPVLIVGADFGEEELYIPADRQALLEPKVRQEEAEQLSAVFGIQSTEPMWRDAFIWPHVGDVTSPFGIRRTYNGSLSSYHAGVDLSGDPGATVLAAAKGRVVLAGPLQVHGNSVILDHGLGVLSAYYHLSDVLVAEGQEVEQGEILGSLGNTGLSTGAHLHWEIRVGGIPVEPSEWTERTIPE
jgi:hypothetical protein